MYVCLCMTKVFANHLPEIFLFYSEASYSKISLFYGVPLPSYNSYVRHRKRSKSNLKQTDFFTFLTTYFCMLKLSYSSDSFNTDSYYNKV